MVGDYRGPGASCRMIIVSVIAIVHCHTARNTQRVQHTAHTTHPQHANGHIETYTTHRPYSRRTPPRPSPPEHTPHAHRAPRRPPPTGHTPHARRTPSVPPAQHTPCTRVRTHAHSCAHRHPHAHTHSHAHTHTHVHRPRATPGQSNRRRPLSTSYQWQPSGYGGGPSDCAPCAHMRVGCKSMRTRARNLREAALPVLVRIGSPQNGRFARDILEKIGC